MLELNKIFLGDCLQVMKDIPDKSIHMVFCDLPYQETECKWDSIIPFDSLWESYKRIIKDNGAIILTASFKFSIKLVLSNIKLFKYELIWDKVKPSNIFIGKLRPMNKHEYILIFSKGNIANGSKKNMRYYPQMEKQKARISKLCGQSDLRYRENLKSIPKVLKEKYPKSILTFSNANNKEKKHPTQKPVSLVEWCIKSFTKENDLVLDNCIGSGTTAIACINTNRNFIGIEKEEKYCQIAEERIHALRSPAQNTMEGLQSELFGKT